VVYGMPWDGVGLVGESEVRLSILAGVKWFVILALAWVGILWRRGRNRPIGLELRGKD
jgi:hypothetical protein